MLSFVASGFPLGNLDRQVEHDEGTHGEQADAEERAEDLLPREEAAQEALLLLLAAALGRRPCRRPAAALGRAYDGRRRACFAPGRALGRRAATAALPRSSFFRSSHGSGPLRLLLGLIRHSGHVSSAN